MTDEIQQRRARLSVPDVTTTLLTLIDSPSISPDSGAAAQTLARLLANRGFDVVTDDWGNTTGRIDFGPGPTLLFDAHVDTVGIGDRSQWRYSPKGVRIGDRIVGRGAVDTKGPLAAAIHAADMLICDPAATGSLIIAGSIDEELAEGPSLGRILDDIAPDVVVIGEPSDGILRIGQRGRAEIVITVTGVAGHSAFPESSTNAVEVMADIVHALRAIEFRTDRALGTGQLTLVSITSKPYPSQSTVPSECVAVFDRRTVLSETASDILDEINSTVYPVAQQNNAHVSVSLAQAEWTTWRGFEVVAPIFASAWFQPPDRWPVADILTAFGRRGLSTKADIWPFCTHGSESAARRGIPTIGFGPGDPAAAHTVDESISMDELRTGVMGYHAIFTTLLSAAR